MSTATEKLSSNVHQLQSLEAFENDLIQDLGRRLGNLWGYDRCIANADGHTKLQEFWRGIKSQEKDCIARLKRMISHFDQGHGPDPPSTFNQ